MTCTGNKETCGQEQKNFVNETDTIKLSECGKGGACWVSRSDKSGVLTFTRECRNTTCTGSTTEEHCKTVNGIKLCEKCCVGDKCNTFYNDGEAGAAAIILNISLILAALLAAFFA